MNFIRNFWKDIKGVSAVEMAILFPILISLMTFIYDLGQGIVLSQKVNTAAQSIGDLVTRNEFVNEALVTDIINAGELSLAPYPLDEFQYDIASVQFDEDGDPFVLWRRTFGMTAEDDPIQDTIGLGGEGEGVIVVSVRYRYVPFFSNIVIDEFIMFERAFLRGRKSATVPCTDCA
ncbi:MAG: TadE/TadG family type IV pilus assembly protein [Pseudomonadota bacterium]